MCVYGRGKIEEMCGGIMRPITEMGCKYGPDQPVVSSEAAVQGLSGSQECCIGNEVASSPSSVFFLYWRLFDIRGRSITKYRKFSRSVLFRPSSHAAPCPPQKKTVTKEKSSKSPHWRGCNQSENYKGLLEI